MAPQHLVTLCCKMQGQRHCISTWRSSSNLSRQAKAAAGVGAELSSLSPNRGNMLQQEQHQSRQGCSRSQDEEVEQAEEHEHGLRVCTASRV